MKTVYTLRSITGITLLILAPTLVAAPTLPNIFGDHMVLRGGCWTTRSRLIRNTWRNFFPPDRRDVLAGFRTCAL